MYQVIIKGKDLDELKKAVNDFNSEVNSKIVSGLEKDLSDSSIVEDVPEVEHIQQVGRAVREINTPSPALDDHIINPPQAAAEMELDSTGLPWDARIHAKTKTKTKLETWKLKKGVDKDLVAQVKTELEA